ncbi:MAG: DUF3427 domain-containing protein [Bryobacterales bacterium]|nr:DUF3427 domain-containing protein [Bryobacterales bacterium]
MRDAKPGLYDQLLTRSLRQTLQSLPTGLQPATADLEEADSPDYLARHLLQQIRLALRALPPQERRQRQLDLTNTLLEVLKAQTGEDLASESIDPPAQLLRALYRTPTPPQPPSTPLSVNSLIMNAGGEPRLGFELERELASADRVLMLVSFIQWRGWQRLKAAFHELTARNAPVRILTTTYIGATDLRAIQELARLPNVDLRISLDGRRRRLHAKAWLFERDSGFSSAYIGSANLSGPALEDGIEWTVKLSQAETPHVLERFRGAFDSLWADPEFEPFHPDDESQCRRVQTALDFSRKSPSGTTTPLFFDLRPHPFQQATLDRLESERADRGFFRNLVVAPTGTGKTFIAAFDYTRQPFTGRRPNLLFLAHREELLRQARGCFRHVLRDESFGDILTGGEEPAAYTHLFATIQSFHSRNLLASQGPGFWHYAVLDEAHHVPAASYRDLIASLQPAILLGLTATPERMDGDSILPWFDHRIADEMRLWHAIERQYLVPFDYYGVHDGTDLSNLSWSRGAYNVSELEITYLHNQRRAHLVVKQFAEIHGAPGQARALGFCVSIRHARFMADIFSQSGIPAAAITSGSSPADRVQAITRLRNREVNVLFTVDLFNEGVDIPELDCVLFLRPTESSSVFLQQLGRGLRLNQGKTNCLVLDFIGNQRREFRFDQRFTALLGGTRRQVIRELETGITHLPGNCYFRLDKESRKVILANLKARLNATRVRMVAELRALTTLLQRTPSLTEYLGETGYDLPDVYKPSIGGWCALCQDAGLLPFEITPEDQSLLSRFSLILHMDSTRRLTLHRRLLVESPDSPDSLSFLDRRLVEMLTFRLLQNEAHQPGVTWSAALERIQARPAVRREFLELNNALLDRIRLHADDTSDPRLPDCPLFLHRQYTRDEVLVALGLPDQVGARHTQTGRFYIEPLHTEVLLVTLDKSDKAFSPTTRYEDYAVSPTRFHWQSQSTTSETSATGQRYIQQDSNGARFLLFVRPRKDNPFVYLGPVTYVSHTGSRPMSIYWDIQTPIPAWFFEICASLRAA